MFSRWIKYRRIEKKIREKLPKYAPISGIRLEWHIVLGYYIYDGFDRYTGKMINPVFVPVPQLIQQFPRAWMKDSKMYRFDWPTKTLTTDPKLRWSDRP